MERASGRAVPAGAIAPRADTVAEIKATARRVLVEPGPDGLALRAVAREMGMTAPALYRYFDSREDLVEHVVADLYAELADDLEAARDATARRLPVRSCWPPAARFRRWAPTHHAEFSLLFGSPGDSVVPADDRRSSRRRGRAGAAARGSARCSAS